MPVVVELWRYPVKSMVGERLATSAVTELGLPGDRGWACRDEERGGIRGAKRLPLLMTLAARYPDGDCDAAPLISLPGGEVIAADAPDATVRVSDAIGRKVTLWPRRPPGDLAHYRRPPPDDPDPVADARFAMGLDESDALPDFSTMPKELMRELRDFVSPLGTYFDAYPLLVITRQSLDALSRRSPGSRVDVRRFRPNLVVDAPNASDEFPELAWAGRRARAGSALIELVVGCKRCAMIGRATAELPADNAMQKVVVRQLEHTFGVYARVIEAGELREGDRFELV